MLSHQAGFDTHNKSAVLREPQAYSMLSGMRRNGSDRSNPLALTSSLSLKSWMQKRPKKSQGTCRSSETRAQNLHLIVMLWNIKRSDFCVGTQSVQ